MKRCDECRKWINRHNSGHRLNCERGKRISVGLASMAEIAKAAIRKIKPEKTYWNGEPCIARIVRVVVGKSLKPTWWCANLEGTEREAVEVKYHDEPFYLDNEKNQGWLKVTLGFGSPQYGHRSLPVERVIENNDQTNS